MPPTSPFSTFPWSLTPHLGDKRSASDTDEEEEYEEENIQRLTHTYSSSGGSDSDSSQVRHALLFLFNVTMRTFADPTLLFSGFCAQVKTQTTSESFILRSSYETREVLIKYSRDHIFRHLIMPSPPSR